MNNTDIEIPKIDSQRIIETIDIRWELILTRHQIMTPVQVLEKDLNFVPIYASLRPKYRSVRETVKMIARYRNNVGVGYYNLDFENTKKLAKFLENFFNLAYPSTDKSNYYFGILPESIEKGDDRANFEYIINTLIDEQLQYKAMVDKAISKEDLSIQDRNIITQKWNDLAFSMRDHKKNAYIAWVPLEKAIPESAIRIAYQWLFGLQEGFINVEKCSFEECENIFVPREAGYTRKFCSSACRIKSYRLKQKISS